MIEKFSIVRQFDTEKLNEKIAYFIYENGYDPYIFANRETIDVLDKKFLNSILTQRTIEEINKRCKNCLIGKYQGYKMFEDNTLEFGEIELR